MNERVKSRRNLTDERVVTRQAGETSLSREIEKLPKLKIKYAQLREPPMN